MQHSVTSMVLGSADQPSNSSFKIKGTFPKMSCSMRLLQCLSFNVLLTWVGRVAVGASGSLREGLGGSDDPAVSRLVFQMHFPISIKFRNPPGSMI